jgi:ribosomal protein S27AE
MLVKIDREDSGHYTLDIEYESGMTYLECHLDRGELVVRVCDLIAKAKPEKVGIVPSGADTPHFLHHVTVRDIISGKRTAQDLTIGESVLTAQQKMLETVSRWYVLRPTPTNAGFYECPVCGRAAVLAAEFLTCGECDSTVQCQLYGYGGPAADLFEVLKTHKERFFINRPWNDKPPWMSREDLFAAMKPFMAMEE